MFQSLKRRVIIFSSAIGMVVFAILFFSIYFAYFTTTMQEISNLLERGLAETPQTSSEFAFQNNFIYTIDITRNGDILTKNFPDDDVKFFVVDSILEGGKISGTIENGNCIYTYASHNLKNGTTRYAVVDCTMFFMRKRSLFITLLVAYIACSLLIVGLSFPFAERFVKPAEEAWKKQKDLVANASHELKTPLTIIDTSIAALQNETDPNNFFKWLSNIGDQTKRMNNLVCEMLELSRFDEQSTPVTIENLDLTEIVGGVAMSFEAAMFEKKISYQEDLAEGVTLNSNRELLERVISNLLENACKYTPNGGSVELTLSHQKDEALIVVKNSGEGIGEGELPYIFDRFYRLDAVRSQSNTNSFGLGLAIVKSIVAKLNGSIEAKSEVGSFTEFTLKLKNM